MKYKNKYKRIFLVLALILVSAVLFNTAYAAISGSDGNVVTTEASEFQKIVGSVAEVFEYILNMASSGVFATIAALINVLFIVFFLVLEVVFVGAVGTEDIFKLPLPDNLVFNRIALFDANFINPANDSIVKGFGNVLGNLFESFRTIAITVFILAAMIAGIKMALSTISSKKAQYKEAAFKWVSGFIFLMCIRIIIAGIFYLNEKLVSILFSVTQETDVMIPIYIMDAVPIFGKPLKDLFNLIGVDTAIYVSGYLGIILSNLAKSIGGNIISSLIGFIILGQSMTIIGSYFKRMFMCILLGIISPLVIAVDTVNAVMGKQSNIFKNWFKNFSITVFTQSIHALYMVVTLQILANLYKANSGVKEAAISIITIILTTGLVKLEKMFKSVFGIGDSFAGDLKDGAHGMIKAMGAVRGLKEGLSAVADNGKKVANAKRMRGNAAGSLTRNYYEKAKAAKASGNMDQYREFMKEAAKYRKEERANLGYNTDPRARKGSQGASQDVVQNTINNQMNRTSNGGGRVRTEEELKRAYDEAGAYEKSARLALLMGPANLLGSMAFSYGMKPDMDETLFKGGYFAKGLDAAAERIGYRAGGGTIGYSHDVAMGQRKGADGKIEKITEVPTEKKVVEKTVVSNFKNPQLYINPAEVTREITKQMKQVGDVFGDTMKKKIKEIDRDIDNQ